MKYIVIMLLALLMWVAYLMEGSLGFSLEKQDNIASGAAESVMDICLKARQSTAHCSCLASHTYKIKTPQSFFDRATSGIFWSKQDAIEKYKLERAQCEYIQ